MMSTTVRDVAKDVAGGTASLSGYDLFNGLSPSRLQGIRVFDVGQGDCVGLLDENDEVTAYVDYGGCIQHPENHLQGYVTSHELAVDEPGSHVTIVLTHWDKDHYWSANKNTQALDCQWLVPRQFVSPTAARLAATLTDARCWPESLGNAAHRFGAGADHEVEIRKCGAFDPSRPSEDRNLTGLAVVLVDRDASGNDDALMLLPGDCPFDRIPALPATGAPIRALLAYHHGSHAHWRSPQTGNVIGNRSANADMAYSYGDPNPYGHPDRSNYPSRLDRAAQTTPDLRAAKARHVDFRW